MVPYPRTAERLATGAVAGPAAVTVAQGTAREDADWVSPECGRWRSSC